MSCAISTPALDPQDFTNANIHHGALDANEARLRTLVMLQVISSNLETPIAGTAHHHGALQSLP